MISLAQRSSGKSVLVLSHPIGDWTSRAHFVFHACGTCIRSRTDIMDLWPLVFPAILHILVCVSHVSYYIARPAYSVIQEGLILVPPSPYYFNTSWLSAGGCMPHPFQSHILHVNMTSRKRHRLLNALWLVPFTFEPVSVIMRLKSV